MPQRGYAIPCPATHTNQPASLSTLAKCADEKKISTEKSCKHMIAKQHVNNCQIRMVARAGFHPMQCMQHEAPAQHGATAYLL